MLATVSDKKLQHSSDNVTVDYSTADVVSANDYYPFGMQMPGRKYSVANTNYRYGFNGKELDKEVAGTTTYDYGFRIYNPGLGRFLSVDPLTKGYPQLTSYQFASNRPIDGIDMDGLEWWSNLKKWLVTPVKAWNTPDGKPPKISPEADLALREGVNNFANLVLMLQGHFEMQEMSVIGAKGNPIASSSINIQKTTLRTVIAEGKVATEVGVIESSTGVINKKAIELHGGNTSSAISNQATRTKSLQVGIYSEMTKLNKKTGLSADHIPSFAAVKKYTESLLGRELTLEQAAALRKNTVTLVYETKIHQTVSRTFAGRNNPVQIARDAGNLLDAIKKDINKLTPSLLEAGYKQADINAAQLKIINIHLPK